MSLVCVVCGSTRFRGGEDEMMECLDCQTMSQVRELGRLLLDWACFGASEK